MADQFDERLGDYIVDELIELARGMLEGALGVALLIMLPLWLVGVAIRRSERRAEARLQPPPDPGVAAMCPQCDAAPQPPYLCIREDKAFWAETRLVTDISATLQAVKRRCFSKRILL